MIANDFVLCDEAPTTGIAYKAICCWEAESGLDERAKQKPEAKGGLTESELSDLFDVLFQKMAKTKGKSRYQSSSRRVVTDVSGEMAIKNPKMVKFGEFVN
jgi:hypothetical protein